MTTPTEEQPQPARAYEAPPAEQPPLVIAGELAGALASCLAEIERNPAPTGWNDHHKYKFLSIAQVTDVVRPLMGRNGLALFVSVLGSQRTDAGRQQLTTVKLACTFAHESGASLTRIWYGEALDSQDKGLNKAYTAGLKQCLLKTFLLADGDEDPDKDSPNANGATKTKKADKPKKVDPPAQPAQADELKAYNRQKAWREVHAELDELLANASAVPTDRYKAALYKFWRVQSLAYVPPDKLRKLVDKLAGLDHPTDAERETERELRMLQLIADQLGDLPEPTPTEDQP